LFWLGTRMVKSGKVGLIATVDSSRPMPIAKRIYLILAGLLVCWMAIFLFFEIVHVIGLLKHVSES
jgi:hypothetical protein